MVIDENVKSKIERLYPLAPLHNPNNLMGINLMEATFPRLKQVAVFDTAFHVSSMPPKVSLTSFFIAQQIHEL